MMKMHDGYQTKQINIYEIAIMGRMKCLKVRKNNNRFFNEENYIQVGKAQTPFDNLQQRNIYVH